MTFQDRIFVAAVLASWFAPTFAADERAAFREAARRVGARRCTLVGEPMAAAIGSGLPVLRATGQMLVDVGSGIIEAVVISLGALVACAAAADRRRAWLAVRRPCRGRIDPAGPAESSVPGEKLGCCCRLTSRARAEYGCPRRDPWQTNTTLRTETEWIA